MKTGARFGGSFFGFSLITAILFSFPANNEYRMIINSEK